MAKTATRSKKQNKKSFLLTLGIILIVGYFILSIVGTRLEINERRQVLVNKNSAYEQQVVKNERLEATVQNEDKSEYIEQVAREKLGFVKPGEKVFYDVTPGA